MAGVVPGVISGGVQGVRGDHHPGQIPDMVEHGQVHSGAAGASEGAPQ
ncbi:hypothetical protein [Actinocrispum wychmicini]|nr:hypothetical protein [Actinocrispum wychmicini]